MKEKVPSNVVSFMILEIGCVPSLNEEIRLAGRVPELESTLSGSSAHISELEGTWRHRRRRWVNITGR